MLRLRGAFFSIAVVAAGLGGAFALANCNGDDNGGQGGGGGGDDAGDDATDGGDGSSSPCGDADLSNDPHHCGRCTVSCSTGEICVQGNCKKQCEAGAPCDGGCFDLSSDLNHCGACGTPCFAPEGGIAPPGDAGSEAGASDGGGDGGGPPPDDGRRIATATCTYFKCGFTCPADPNVKKCTDGCWDITIAHDHCGDCATACASTENCDQGTCCAQGSLMCNGTCTDVTTDPNNCGACGATCASPGKCQGGACVGYSNATGSLAFVDACKIQPHAMVLPSLSSQDSPLYALPFTFHFFKQPVTKYYVSTAGFIGFTPASLPPISCPLPYANNPPQTVYVMGSYNTTSAQGICIAEPGTQPNRTLVVTWKQVEIEFDQASVDDVSIVLHEGTDVIDMLYGSIGSGTYAGGRYSIVGLQLDKNVASEFWCGPKTFQNFVTSAQTPYSIRWTPL